MNILSKASAPNEPATLPSRYPAPMADQFMYCARTLHDSTCRCTITFAGRADVERMARAVRLTLDAQPVLGCRLLQYVGLLSSTYRALVTDPAYRPACSGGAGRGYGPLFRQLGRRKLLAACRRLPDPRVAWGLPPAGADCADRYFLTRRLAPGQVFALKAYARQQQVTLNPILLTGFYRALCAIIDPQPGIPLVVQATANLRRYLPAADGAIGNMSGPFSPAIERVPDEPFAATLVMMLEDNTSIQWDSATFGSHHYKTWRIYDLDL